MKKPVGELVAGEVIVALVHPDGREIMATNRNRAPPFANGVTHAVVVRCRYPTLVVPREEHRQHDVR
jgi:hypothetical protein